MRWPRSPTRGAALLLALVGASTAAAAAAAAAAAQGQTTIASVYLPEYRDSDWEVLRGSILTKVDLPLAVCVAGRTLTHRKQDHSMTTYTIFCADEAPQCRIVQDIPFVFTQGPSTLKYGGSASSGAREMYVTPSIVCVCKKLTARQKRRPPLQPGGHHGCDVHGVVVVWVQLPPRHRQGSDADRVDEHLFRSVRRRVGSADAGHARARPGHHEH